jgi:predicted transcriptional regulator
MEILSEAVTAYDARDRPVTPTDVAEATSVDLDAIRATFEEFESKHLLKRVESGYRPTVTARELLELDIDDDALLILDAEPEQ